MVRFADDRAPLEMTKTSTVMSILVICPHCKLGRYVSKTWLGSICNGCHKYFNWDEALTDENEAKSIIPRPPIDKEFTAVKAEMEEKAYKWKDEQEKKQKQFGRTKHEPRE